MGAKMALQGFYTSVRKNVVFLRKKEDGRIDNGIFYQYNRYSSVSNDMDFYIAMNV